MSVSDENLAQLFSQARNQQPVASLGETKKAFMTATVVAAGGVLATKGLLQLLTTKKWIIMLSTVTIITTGTLIASLASNPTETAENTPLIDNQNSIMTVDEPQENIEAVADATPYIEPIIPTELSEVDRNNIFELIEDESDFLEENDFIVEEDSQGIEFKTLPQSSEPRLAESTGEIKPYSQRFDITQNTTKSDFEQMKKDAEKDGVDFHYKAKYDKDDKLTKLTLELRIEPEEDADHQYVMTNLSVNGDFKYTVAWDNPKGGQSRIYVGDTDQFDAEGDDTQGAIEDAINEIEIIIAELDLDELFDGLDSLAEQMDNTAEFQWDGMEDEMVLLERKIKEAIEEFGKEDIQLLMLELKESSVEMVKVLQEELEQIQIELEKEKEEIEKEKEEIKKEKEEIEKEKKINKDKGDKKEDDGTRI
jgi:hypothetical protein